MKRLYLGSGLIMLGLLLSAIADKDIAKMLGFIITFYITVIIARKMRK